MNRDEGPNSTPPANESGSSGTQNDDAGGAGGAPTQVRFSVVRQYIKDLSFENPNAPQSMETLGQPQININVNVGAEAGENDQFEVSLTISALAKHDEATLFAVELVYVGIFQLAGLPRDQMQPLILIECPRLLFPFARNILADTSRHGGFAPLMIDPIDFAGLYRANLERQETSTEEHAPAN